MSDNPKICSVCGNQYFDYGNNAWPINPGRCCDRCNGIVVTARIRNVQRGLSAYHPPEWFVEFTRKKVPPGTGEQSSDSVAHDD